jgi:eukaryotic-like serine/threonine-protein kinase
MHAVCRRIRVLFGAWAGQGAGTIDARPAWAPAQAVIRRARPRRVPTRIPMSAVLPSPPLSADTPAEAPARPGARAADLPRHIGKYRVRAKIGEGATSEVFLAHDPFRGIDVAIKRVRLGALPESRETHFQRRFFAAEAALVGQLNHPNVVQILDAVEDDVAPYLVMEYVAGITLRRHCRADRLLPLDQILEIGFKCAMALGYCFRQGLIHRDVKPANILATVAGERIADIKITDFGSAFNFGAEQTQVFRVGSLAYMSPEQLDGDTLDCRADLYSLSAVLYHLVAGRPPFDATEQAAIMQQIYHGTPPPLAGLREGVPAALQTLLEAGLAKRREDRPESWEAFADTLAALVRSDAMPRADRQEVLDSERFKLLRPLEFFTGFGDVELWEVVHRGQWQRLAYGHAIYRKGESGRSFHIVAEGRIEVYRDGRRVATLGGGQSVGEMAYLAPSEELRQHSADVLVAEPATTLAFTPETLGQLSPTTRLAFDQAFIRVLVRRLHAAHEALHHPRRIL